MTTSLLSIPERTPRAEHPFWHRRLPTIATINLDPGYERLRSIFPRSWQAMVRAKSALDSISSLARLHIQDIAEYRRRIRPLLEFLAQDLATVAELEQRYGAELVSDQAGGAAEAIHCYILTGTWPTVDLHAPSDSEPWIFCGPLTTWAMQESYEPLTLLVTEPSAHGQVVIDHVSAEVPTLTRSLSTVLGDDVRPGRHLPDMMAVTLLLTGGVSTFGHKNFAHFFPLEAPSGFVKKNEFTVVFANMHRERLRRCSLRLLDGVAGTASTWPEEEVLDASMAWFRSHDIAHFWQKGGQAVGVGDQVYFSPFERMLLNETQADTLGLAALTGLVDPGVLGIAFAAEMLRYLSRNHSEFADSGAAVLELGWLEERVDLTWSNPDRWITEALPPLVDVARTVDAALSGAPEAVAPIRRALRHGAQAARRWSDLFADTASDVDYTFG